MSPSDAPTQAGLFETPRDERTSRTRASMLWAAYADALGFISELVDEKGLRRRTRGKPLEDLIDWRRRVGGRSGVDMDLPAGCWSDDTQLRMAVGRAIGPHGFDVEAFARIELPVWPSYALGGGRASKAAAAALGKSDALWYANQFDGWERAGGNGAAMRVQPHVWASPKLDGDFLSAVIKDSVCTHGHPRAIVGACFHALTLAHCLQEGAVPDGDECLRLAESIRGAIRLIDQHRSLGPTWRGLWEKASGRSLDEAWEETVDELQHALSAATTSGGSPDEAYDHICSSLGLDIEEQRGSGILTPVAAVLLAGVQTSTREAVLTACNRLGTDTDTIATMVGALMGAATPSDVPPSLPLDSEYLVREADRLSALAAGGPTDPARYPDLLVWAAPRTQADALVVTDHGLVVEGLGPVEPLGDSAFSARRDFAWMWVRTTFGQTLLIKHRPDLPKQQPGNQAMELPLEQPSRPTTFSRTRRAQQGSRPVPRRGGVNLDGAVDHVRGHPGDDAALAYTLRRVAREGSLAELVALVVALRDDLRH